MMKTRVQIYFAYGKWRVRITNIGGAYDIRRINRDMLNAANWCDMYNRTGYAPVGVWAGRV